MKQPIFLGNQLNTSDDLANLLEISTRDLFAIACEAHKYYKANTPKIKPNGTVRQTYRVEDPLKSIQSRLKTDIFYEVIYPNYLQGSVKDFEKTRNYITNAELHVKKRIVINEDISNFFPSIKKKYVYHLWRSFFGFEDYVAKILTDLTTFQGFVPQGAATSSYIATLIFWDQEPTLENEFRKKNLTYSRLVDDITVSSDKYLTTKEQQKITENIYNMLFTIGVKPNRKKRKVHTNNRKMSVNKRNVNSSKPTLPSKERAKIRSAVKECETIPSNERSSEAYLRLFNKTFGRVAEMSKLHPHQAGKLRKRLEAITPIRKKE